MPHLLVVGLAMTTGCGSESARPAGDTVSVPLEQRVADARESERLLPILRARIQENVENTGEPAADGSYCRDLKLRYARRYGSASDTAAALGPRVYRQMQLLCRDLFPPVP